MGVSGQGHLKNTCGILDTAPSFQTPNYSYLIKEIVSPKSCSTSALNSPLGLQEPKRLFNALSDLEWGRSHGIQEAYLQLHTHKLRSLAPGLGCHLKI